MHLILRSPLIFSTLRIIYSTFYSIFYTCLQNLLKKYTKLIQYSLDNIINKNN